ncbi:MAG: gliding motility-associated ABC transporter substrate-binding protein GldG [Bacteroidota bacterium]|nr:gliding motility-associated ABC transporter substrate-binding protein GldG [Bacteroidota bacterium]
MASKQKRKDIVNLVLTIAAIVMINFIGAYYFKRFDLTTEKRYTLNEQTINLLKNLDDDVYIKVYLEGEFNPAFTRLQTETKEMLDEFRALSKNDFNYEFIDIYAEKNKGEVEKVQRELYGKGIIPVELNIKSESGNKSQVVFPGAIVTYKGKQTAWQIFRQQVGIPPEVCINNSVSALEYELSNSIKKLQQTTKKRIAFIQGHNELDTLQTAGIYDALKEYYEIDYVSINHHIKALKPYSAIIVARPDSAIDEKDKFIIDQFIMKGGKALFCIDQVYTNNDTLRAKGYTLGLSLSKNLDDMLFSYGVRINYNLLNDYTCTSVPVNRGFKGAPDFQMAPWYYNPLVLPGSEHLIVKNLDLIRFEFVSNIDTITSKGVKKTVLLSTSKNTRIQNTPARISLAMTMMKPKDELFKKGPQPVAVLLEGNFNSVYAHRIPFAISQDSAIGFVEKSSPTSVIVISDGDVIRNEIQYSTLQPYPLGYDKFMKQTFANKTFILNCMNYLCDGPDFLNLRAREVKLRMLDKKKLKNESGKWKMINVSVPIISIIVVGIILTRLRKRKYTKKY